MQVRTLLPLIVALSLIVSAPCGADDIGQAVRLVAQSTDDISVSARPYSQSAVAEDIAIAPNAERTVPAPSQPARALRSIQVQR